jgi:hypothetical protein
LSMIAKIYGNGRTKFMILLVMRILDIPTNRVVNGSKSSGNKASVGNGGFSYLL